MSKSMSIKHSYQMTNFEWKSTLSTGDYYFFVEIDHTLPTNFSDYWTTLIF